MKVLIVSKYFPPDIRGGGEISAYYLAKALSNSGIEVYVITLKTIHPNESCFKIYPIIKHRHLPGILNRISNNELFYFDTYKAVSSFVKINDIDVIHAMNMDTIPGVILASKRCCIPSVITVNSQWVTCPHGLMLKMKDMTECDGTCNILKVVECYCFSKMRNIEKILGALYAPFQMSFRQYMSSKADAIVCVSDSIRKKVSKNIKNKNIFVMPSDIIEPEQPPKQTYPSDLLFVGAVGRYKGCDFLVRAMKEVVKEFNNCRLIVCGDGEDLNKCKIMALRYGLQENIIFKGHVPHSELDKYYYGTKIIVVPSIVPETFGRVVAEAMSAGKPVIATSTGALPEIIKHSVNGFVVEPNNYQSMAKSIIYLLRNNDSAINMGENGKTRVKKYSSESVASGYINLYNSIRNNK